MTNRARLKQRIGCLDITEEPLSNFRSLANRYAFAFLGKSAFEDIERAVSIAERFRIDGLLTSSPHAELWEPTGTLVLGGSKSRAQYSFIDAKNTDELGRGYKDARFCLQSLLEGQTTDQLGLIDATAIPKYLLGFLIGLLLRTRSVGGLDILYRRARYFVNGVALEDVYADPKLRQEIYNIEFGLAPVPYVEGKYNAAKRRHVIMLAGMDYQRTYFKAKELEPAIIDVVIDGRELEGPLSGMDLITFLRKRLDDDVATAANVPCTSVVKAIEAIKVLLAKPNGETDGLQPMFIVSGWKSFVIAGVLQSVMGSEVPLFVTIPDHVVPMDAAFFGDYSLYRIRDRTVL